MKLLYLTALAYDVYVPGPKCEHGRTYHPFRCSARQREIRNVLRNSALVERERLRHMVSTLRLRCANLEISIYFRA